jgi:hypothetical protein
MHPLNHSSTPTTSLASPKSAAIRPIVLRMVPSSARMVLVPIHFCVPTTCMRISIWNSSSDGMPPSTQACSFDRTSTTRDVCRATSLNIIRANDREPVASMKKVAAVGWHRWGKTTLPAPLYNSMAGIADASKPGATTSVPGSTACLVAGG